jgi:hypothetical protein
LVSVFCGVGEGRPIQTASAFFLFNCLELSGSPGMTNDQMVARIAATVQELLEDPKSSLLIFSHSGQSPKMVITCSWDRDWWESLYHIPKTSNWLSVCYLYSHFTNFIIWSLMLYEWIIIACLLHYECGFTVPR